MMIVRVETRRAETAVDIECQSNHAAARRICRNGIADSSADGLRVGNRAVICRTAADNLQSRSGCVVACIVGQRNGQNERFARFGKSVIVARRIGNGKGRGLK